MSGLQIVVSSIISLFLTKCNTSLIPSIKATAKKLNIYKTIPPPSVKLKEPFALFRLRKGGGIVSTWNEMCQNGYLIIDQEHRVAAKSVSDQETTAEIIKDILAKVYINYLIHNGKEST